MYSERELIYQVKEKNIEFEYILEKYNPLINKYAKKYSYLKKCGLEYEDIYQIASMSLYESIKSFNLNINTKFSTYYSINLKNKIRNELKKINSYKNIINKDTISLEKDGMDLLEVIPNNYNELDYIYESDYYDKIKELKKELSFIEICIVDLYLEGFKAKEIQCLLEENYNYIRKIISKIKDFDFTHTCLN